MPDDRPPRPQSAGLEAGLHALLAELATHPAAQNLADDCAVLDWPLGLQLVATHDMLAEGVHFTADCPPVDIGWKLVAVNLSDLAANGAKPVGVLMGAGIGRERGLDWARELVRGMGHALQHFNAALLGGDTIRTIGQSVLTITAIGSVPAGAALTRGGASAGDDLWLSGDIGAAGLGLRVVQGHSFGAADAVLRKRFRRPQPRVALGLALRQLASAAIDVSDGVLIDAGRLAAASGLQAQIDSAALPLSAEAIASGVAVARLASFGDDYELLFAAPTSRRDDVHAAASAVRVRVQRIGRLQAGAGIYLDGRPPTESGYQHF